MYRGISLSASVMCLNWLNAEQDLKALNQLEIDFLHIDVIDGTFAPDFTFGSSIINLLRNNSDLPFDYHLMAEEPSSLFEAFPVKENDFFSIHQESARNLHRDLVRIKRNLSKVGVVLSPATPIDTLEYIIEDVDLVTLMTVNPGYMGQSLVPQVLKKIEKTRELVNELELETRIAADGNVSIENIPAMVAAGANHLVLGSSGLFRKGVSFEQAMIDLKQAIDKGLDGI